MKTFACICLLAISLTTSLSAQIQHFQIDKDHSSIFFRIKHFSGKVAGTFENFEGEIYFNEKNIKDCQINVSILSATIDTNQETRDQHLKSEDFLASSSHPTIEFKSTSWKKKSKNTYEVIGNLSMLDTQQPATIIIELLDIRANATGEVISGWEGRGAIDRTSWGMTHGVPELGKIVDFIFQIEAIEK